MSQIVNVKATSNEIQSDISEVDKLKKEHRVVEVGGCFDKDKIYSMYTSWGVIDAESGEVSE